jgi:predicted aldo/keto reductase-like oxidoreductase
MNYRRLGRTDLKVSVIGFGTAQLRLVPEKQAVLALIRAFEFGINIVHTAPDYECAEKYIAQALAATPNNKVFICSQGWGTTKYFESLFERTCKNLSTDYLDLYGLASIYDMEKKGGNVWGNDGMVEFLLKKKDEGRIGHIFCTTHGPPEHTRKLIETNVFDALMIAYNDLGFHAYSHDSRSMWNFCSGPIPHHIDTNFEPEDLTGNKKYIFPRAERHDLGLIIMKPFAAGHLGRSKALPPRDDGNLPGDQVQARETLRSILMNAGVSCVVPGMASIEEVEENVIAGSGNINLSTPEIESLNLKTSEIKKALCSSCGECNSLCSHNLPISWLFRAYYIGQYPSATGESWDDIEYFTLHPAETSTCSHCTDVTCRCPNGINIKNSLIDIHKFMIHLTEKSLIPKPSSQVAIMTDNKDFAARVIAKEIPSAAEKGSIVKIGIFLENAGTQIWSYKSRFLTHQIQLVLSVNGKRKTTIFLHRDVPAGERTYITLTFVAPKKIGRYPIKLELLKHRSFLFNRDKLTMAETIMQVT